MSTVYLTPHPLDGVPVRDQAEMLADICAEYPELTDTQARAVLSFVAAGSALKNAGLSRRLREVMLASARVAVCQEVTRG